jgi:cell division septation protein DedD
MEHFETNPNPVKQKSVYLLHLDAPRIVLISSLIIGLIVVSFLIGMNFVEKNGGTASSLAQNDLFLNDQKGGDLLNENIPAPPKGGESAKLDDDKILFPESGNKTKEKDPKITPAVNPESSDVLTSDSIKEIIPPSREKTDDNIKDLKKSEKKYSSREKTAHKGEKSKKNKNVKSNKKESNKSNRVVEVSSPRLDKSASAGDHNGFFIQIASYDKKSRALSEIEHLKDMKYDASIDRSTVEGKEFFRVRIGPMASREKAADLLQSIQENPRYEDCYIVKQ